MKPVLFFNTIRHLKPRQIGYRVFYSCRRLLRSFFGIKTVLHIPARGYHLHLIKPVSLPKTWFGGFRFAFLNLGHDFEDSIDWNFSAHDKLWTYNLSYFDFLQQEECDKNTGFRLINNFIDNLSALADPLDPYPISLRGVNWIKFISEHDIKDSRIDSSLYAQYAVLLDNLEYHLMGNHLLENAFSLLFASYYFRDRTFYAKAHKILSSELAEQILSDGGHFELSPMYHQIILSRVLDSINLIKNNRWMDDALVDLLSEKAKQMLGWLNLMTFANGEIPLFNDSAYGVAPSSEQLFAYARRLEIDFAKTTLGESGYRRFAGDNYELIVDAGPIGPDYIPGHAHADMFNFELYSGGSPLIVDVGVSTYDVGEKRSFEKSTKAHNTVVVDNMDQSEMWSSFRVGRRARLKILEDSQSLLLCEHDGYKATGIIHRRQFETDSKRIVLHDWLMKSGCGIARFHLSPKLNARLSGNSVAIGDSVLNFQNASNISLESYQKADGFNILCDAVCVSVEFNNELKTVIEI